jgi:thioredoxin-related protein
LFLYEKGLRDIYDPLKKLFPQVGFYQVLIDRDPQIAQIYDIQTSPTTMFIPLTGEILFIPGFLTPEEAKKNRVFN